MLRRKSHALNVVPRSVPWLKENCVLSAIEAPQNDAHAARKDSCHAGRDKETV
jgi:hypothetical protein